jgi:hypothetical protein
VANASKENHEGATPLGKLFSVIFQKRLPQFGAEIELSHSAAVSDGCQAQSINSSGLRTAIEGAVESARRRVEEGIAHIGTKGDVFVLTEEQRHEMQAITKEVIASYPTDPVEWDKWQEEHSFNPRRATERLNNANALDDETQQFRCEQCYELFNRSQIASDGKRCQGCAGE